jgi:hypothetical protein
VGKVVKFPHDKVVRDIGRHKVCVSFIMEWEGINGEHAAVDAAKAVIAAVGEVPDFYAPARVMWGEVAEGKAPCGA